MALQVADFQTNQQWGKLHFLTNGCGGTSQFAAWKEQTTTDKFDVTTEPKNVYDLATKCTNQADVLLGKNPIDHCKLLEQSLDNINPSNLKSLASTMQEGNNSILNVRVPNVEFQENPEGQVTSITFKQDKGHWIKRISWQK